MDKRETGAMGENAACAELERRGHTIVARNFHKPFGEIDIISQTGGFIVFNEVKTRVFGSPALGIEAVDARKQRKIVATADAYMAQTNCALQPRYDIIEVVVTRGDNARVAEVIVYEDAFGTDGIYTAF